MSISRKAAEKLNIDKLEGERLLHFLRINDNIFTGSGGRPIFAWVGLTGTAAPKIFKEDAGKYVAGELMKKLGMLTPNIVEKIKFYHEGFGAETPLGELGMLPSNTVEKIKSYYEAPLRELPPPKSGSKAEKILNEYNNKISPQPVIKKAEVEEVEVRQYAPVFYRGETLDQIMISVPPSTSDIPEISDQIIMLENTLSMINDMIRKKSTTAENEELANEELTNEELMFEVQKLEDLIRLRAALEKKINNYKTAKNSLELKFIRDTIVGNLEAIRGFNIGIEEYRGFLIKIKESGINVDGQLRTLLRDVAPVEYKKIIDNLPVTTPFLQILDIQPEMPPLEDVEPPTDMTTGGNFDDPVSGGPDENTPDAQEPQEPPSNVGQENVPTGVTVPLVNKPKYHLKVIDEFFGSKTRPEWDTDLMNKIKEETYTKEEVIKNCDTIIEMYGKKLCIFSRKSEGDKDEYNELRQLQFCMERGLQKGTRSRKAAVNLSDLVGLGKLANKQPGPIDPSKVEGALSSTANAPQNTPNLPNTVFVKEMPTKNNEKGIFIDPKYIRPNTFVEVYY